MLAFASFVQTWHPARSSVGRRIRLQTAAPKRKSSWATGRHAMACRRIYRQRDVREGRGGGRFSYGTRNPGCQSDSPRRQLRSERILNGATRPADFLPVREGTTGFELVFPSISSQTRQGRIGLKRAAVDSFGPRRRRSSK